MQFFTSIKKRELPQVYCLASGYNFNNKCEFKNTTIQIF